MLSEVCKEIRNWFDQARYFGRFTIKDGVITSDNDGDMGIQANQYFRIVDSVFNDGVYKNDDTLSEKLTNEVFNGAVWLMAVPKDFLDLVSEIEAWQAKYGGVDSASMSPFNSESFGGYSYSKSGGGSSSGDGTGNEGTWQGAFAGRLNNWRKI